MSDGNADYGVSSLMPVPKPQYGNEYVSHCLEIYKLAVEMADRISQRRQTANAFFLSINTLIIGGIGYVAVAKAPAMDRSFQGAVAIAGTALCFLWFSLIVAFKQMNTHKFQVIHEIEALLPLAPYTEEWRIAGRGKDWSRYVPFTVVEMCVPWVFLVLHQVALLGAVLA